jgi:hypothetical protein
LAHEAQKGLEKELNKLAIVDDTASGQSPEGPAEGEASRSVSASSSSTLPGASDEPPQSPTSSATNLFARLQASLPPDLIHTLQSNLPESIRHAPERLNVTQLRSTLQQVRLEDATVRGEELFRSASVFLRDAVRVLPPTESTGAAAGAKGKAPVRDGAIGTRKDALLRSLRSNGGILKIDPAAEKISEALFRTWEEKEVAAREGGILGEEWKDRIVEELEEAGESLVVMKADLGAHILGFSWGKFGSQYGQCRLR